MLDLETEWSERLDIEEWINRNSLHRIHELREANTAKLLNMIKTPTLIVFFEESDPSRQEVIEGLDRLAERYSKDLVFIYVKDESLLSIRNSLGAHSDQLPTATIVTFKGIIYPMRSLSDFHPNASKLFEETLEKYIKAFITGRIRAINNDQFHLSLDQGMIKRLTHTQSLGGQ